MSTIPNLTINNNKATTRTYAYTMGYNVEYNCTLFVSDSEPDNIFHYSRGLSGWSGDAPPEGHQGEGLVEGLVDEDQVGEWIITIEGGKVKMKFRSEKFYPNYMTRMLKLLKERVPSLSGYVSCDLDKYWVVTLGKEVITCHFNIHDFAKEMYDKTCKAHEDRKRQRES